MIDLSWLKALVAKAATKTVKVVKAAAVTFVKQEDDTPRLNYYADSDFAAYQEARRTRVPDETGTLPWIDREKFYTPCPTPEQWATLTAEQKADKGSVRF